MSSQRPCEHCRATGDDGAGVPARAATAVPETVAASPMRNRYGETPVGVVVHVAGCAGQGAVIDVGEGWPEHDRREDVGAIDDGGAARAARDAQLSEAVMM